MAGAEGMQLAPLHSSWRQCWSITVVSLFGGDMEISGKRRLDMKSEIIGAGLITQSGYEKSHDERRPPRKLGIPYVAVVVDGYGGFHLCVSLAA